MCDQKSSTTKTTTTTPASTNTTNAQAPGADDITGCDEDIKELKKELDRIFKEAESRRDRGDNPQFIFMDLVEEIDKVSEAAGGGFDATDFDIVESRKELARALDLDFAVPREWQNSRINQILLVAEEEKQGPEDNISIFEKLKRQIEHIYELAHRAVDSLWDPEELESQNRRLADILDVHYPSELGWLKVRIESIFEQAEVEKCEEPEVEQEVYQTFAEQIIGYIQHTYFYHQMEGAAEFIDESLDTLKEIMECTDDDEDDEEKF